MERIDIIRGKSFELPQIINSKPVRMTVLMVFLLSTACPAALATTVNMQSGLKADSVTVNSGHTLTTGANTLDVESASAGITTAGTGTLNATNATITLAGKFQNSATGTFTSTGSSITFDATSGPLNIDSGGDAFNTVTINASGVTYTAVASNISAAALTVTAGTLDLNTNGLDLAVTNNLLLDGGSLNAANTACDIDVNGNLTVSSGTLTAPGVADDTSFTVGGNWNISGTGIFTHSSGRVVLDAGATGKTIVTTSSGADDFYDVKFNNAAGGWTASDAMEVARHLDVTAGAFTAPAAANLTVAGDLLVSGTFTHNSGSVVLNGAADATQVLNVNANDVAGSVTFYNLTKSVTGTGTTSKISLDDADTFTVTNTLSLTGVSGNHLLLTSDHGTNTVDFDYTKAGTGTQTITYVDATRIDSDTGVDIVYDNTSTVASCVGWVTGGFNIVWDGAAASTAWNNGNNWNLGTIPGTASTVTIPSSSYPPALDQDRTVGALTIQNGGELNLNTRVLTVTNTLSNTGTLTVSTAGTPFSAGTFTNNPGSLVNYTGVAADTAVNVVAGTYDDITFNNAGTNFLLQGNIIANDDLTVTAGTLDTDADGAGAGTTIYNLTAKGNANFSGTFTARTSTVTLFNDGVDEIKTLTTGGNAFNNLIINHTAATTNTVRVSGALDVNGTLTLSDGTLDLDTNNVTVNTAGDVSITSGATVTKDAEGAIWKFDGTTQNYTDSNVTKQNLGVVAIG